MDVNSYTQTLAEYEDVRLRLQEFVAFCARAQFRLASNVENLSVVVADSTDDIDESRDVLDTTGLLSPERLKADLEELRRLYADLSAKWAALSAAQQTALKYPVRMKVYG